MRRSLLAAAVMLAVAAGCSVADVAAPRCRAGERLALVAQSVPGAAYVPCVAELPAGWSVTGFSARDGSTELTLVSDRADRPVHVELRRSCDIGGATPTVARAIGVRTYLHLASISPRYAGVLLDVFPGGCVTYEFEFERGPHIALVDDLQHAVGLFSRRDLDQALDRAL